MSTLRVAKRDGNDEEGEDATREEGRWEMQGSELVEEEAGGKSGNPAGLSSISIAPSNVTTRRCVFCSDFGLKTKRAEDEGR